MDPVIRQYIEEGLHAFSSQLTFASAVMFGAASEKAVLLLLAAIGQACKDARRADVCQKLLERPRLPRIFEIIRESIDEAKKNGGMPYEIHQGCTEHLNSFSESVRVQRNNAVHPEAGRVNRDKVFLTIQTFPVALQVVHRLTGWFRENKI